MSDLIYDGHNIGELFDVGDPEITLFNSLPDLRDVPARDGSAFVGIRYGASTVTCTIAVDGPNRRDKLSTLGMWLNVDGPRKLVLPDTPDWYYLAVPSNSVSLTRLIDADVAKLTFTLVDPVSYGRKVFVTIPSGGSKTFNVGGTYGTKPTVSASAAVRNASSHVWGVRLDSGDVMQIATGSGSARAVVFDCEKRACYLSGALTLPTLNSDWFVLEPGTHTIANDQGTGACTVSYVERWL